MFLTRGIMLMIIALVLVQQAHGKAVHDDNAFNSWFGHISASVPVLHLNDEGSPYRFSLGAGHPFIFEDLSLMVSGVYGYYDVNANADNNPSVIIEGGSSHSLGLDLILRWSFLKTPHGTYLIEGGGGFQSMLTDPPFPADGYTENFTLYGGPGILIPAGEKNRILISLQWFHISNANWFPENSGYDGVQLIAGFEWAVR